MDSYYSCNIVLEGVKASTLAGTQKGALRNFHIHMDNCIVHNSKLTKEKWTKSGSFDGTIPHTHPILHPWTFDFSLGAKER
jgi:hypothetical protein